MPARSRRFVTPVTGVLALALAVAALGTALVPATQANADSYAVRGVDVASWQHPSGKAINWSKVKAAGYSFAIIKATESTTYANPYFAADRTGAASAGLVVGAYHFARPALPLSTATAQARYFAARIGNQQLSRTLPPILDIESTGGLSKPKLAAWMTEFLTTLRSITGRTPMIYSYDSFLRNSVASVSNFRGYPLWYANYTTITPKAMPGAWPAWKLWQHTSTGKVPGISGQTDLNRFNGSYSALLSFASGKVGASIWQRKTQPHEPAYITGRVDPAFYGEPIVRQTKTKKGWSTVSTKRIAIDGSYSFAVSPSTKGSHTFRVALRAASPYAHIHSDPVTVKVVRRWIHVHATKTSMKKGRATHVTGRVDTFYAGERVVRQKRTSSGRWVTVSAKHVQSNGRFDFAVSPKARQTYAFRVVLKATGPTAKVPSRTLRVRVH